MNRTLITGLTLTLALIGCGGDKGKGPSYCEALCDWATECAVETYGVDPETTLADCLAATEAAAGSCGSDPSIAEEKLLTECTDAVAEAQSSGDCSGFTGTEAEVTASAAPADCATQDGYDAGYTAAQDSVIPDNAEMCEAFYGDFCEKLEGCISSTTGYDPATLDTTPADVCNTALSGRVDECISGNTFERSETNTQRAAATECIGDLNDATCEDIFSGNIPAVCAGAFVDANAAAEFATSLADVGAQFASSR
jgi:hypothetical protein